MSRYCAHDEDPRGVSAWCWRNGQPCFWCEMERHAAQTVEQFSERKPPCKMPNCNAQGNGGRGYCPTHHNAAMREYHEWQAMMNARAKSA